MSTVAEPALAGQSEFVSDGELPSMPVLQQSQLLPPRSAGGVTVTGPPMRTDCAGYPSAGSVSKSTTPDEAPIGALLVAHSMTATYFCVLTAHVAV